MDPLSITAAVATVVAGCLSTAQSLNELRSKWKLTSMTMGSLCSEVAIITAALSQIQCILEARCEAGESASKSILRPQFVDAFDISLTGCAVILSCIDYEVRNMKMVDIGHELDWKAKVKALWKEDTMKELISQLRGQYTALGILTQTLQMTSLEEIKATLDKHSKLIDKIACDTISLRESYTGSFTPGDQFSIVTGSLLTEIDPKSTSENIQGRFVFDDLLVNAGVYRRAFNRFIQTERVDNNLGIQSKFVEEDLIDLSGPDEPVQASSTQSDSLAKILDDLKGLEDNQNSQVSSSGSIRRKPVPIIYSSESVSNSKREPNEHQSEHMDIEPVPRESEDIDWGSDIINKFSTMVTDLGIDQHYGRATGERRTAHIVEIPDSVLPPSGTVEEIAEDYQVHESQQTSGSDKECESTEDQSASFDKSDNGSLPASPKTKYKRNLLSLLKESRLFLDAKSSIKPKLVPYMVLYNKEKAQDFAEDLKTARTYVGPDEKMIESEEMFVFRGSGGSMVGVTLLVIDRAGEISRLIPTVSSSLAALRLSTAYRQLADMTSLLNNYSATYAGETLGDQIEPLLRKFKAMSSDLEAVLKYYESLDSQGRNKARGLYQNLDKAYKFDQHQVAVDALKEEMSRLIPKGFKIISDIRLAITGVASRIPAEMSASLVVSASPAKELLMG